MSERIQQITQWAALKVREAREALERAEKELDLTYRFACQIPKDAIAPARWYHDENITILYKPECTPIVVIGEFSIKIKERYIAPEVTYAFVRINGVWQ